MSEPLIAEDLLLLLTDDRLVERGFLRHESTRFMGFNKWPAADSTHEDHVRAGLYRVMVDNEEPTTRQAALIALLAALGVIVKVAAEAGHALDRKAAKRRAKELMEQNWASAAVRQSVQSVQSATAAAVMAGGAAGGDGGGS